MSIIRLELKVTVGGTERVFFLALGESDPESKEPTSWTVTLLRRHPDTSQIPLIKEIRACLNLGLKEAKDMVDSAPSVLADKVSFAKAEEIRRAVYSYADVKVEANY